MDLFGHRSRRRSSSSGSGGVVFGLKGRNDLLCQGYDGSCGGVVDDGGGSVVVVGGGG